MYRVLFYIMMPDGIYVKNPFKRVYDVDNIVPVYADEVEYNLKIFSPPETIFFLLQNQY